MTAKHSRDYAYLCYLLPFIYVCSFHFSSVWESAYCVDVLILFYYRCYSFYHIVSFLQSLRPEYSIFMFSLMYLYGWNDNKNPWRVSIKFCCHLWSLCSLWFSSSHDMIWNKYRELSHGPAAPKQNFRVSQDNVFLFQSWNYFQIQSSDVFTEQNWKKKIQHRTFFWWCKLYCSCCVCWESHKL